jgi:hypothetical protein
MFGPFFQQTMKARLGVGKPLDGYSMTPQQSPMIDQPHILGGGPGPGNAGVNPWGGAAVGGAAPIPFQPRPQGGILPNEDPWNAHSTPYQPRPQNPYEQPFDPRSRGYENRPQGGGNELPEQGWGGQTSPWRKF